MDLIAYCAALFVVGLIGMFRTRNVSESSGIIDTGKVSEVANIPIGNNLALKKDRKAFTLILEELNLWHP